LKAKDRERERMSAALYMRIVKDKVSAEIVEILWLLTYIRVCMWMYSYLPVDWIGLWI